MTQLPSDDGGGGAAYSFCFSDARGTIQDPRRLEQLRNTGLLSARHRPALDVITHLAAVMTEAPTAMVSLVEVDRQIFVSFHGPEPQQEEVHETPISRSICQYVVMTDAPLVFEDARKHPVLASHPAVVEGALVAYAGFPVHAPDGEVLGALCVTDVVPRAWTAAQLAGLKDLATAVDTKIALRLSRRELHLDHERLMHVLDAAAHTLIVIADVNGTIRTTNRAAKDALGQILDLVGTTTLSDLPGLRRSHGGEGGPDDSQDWTLVQPNGEQRIFSVRVSALHDPEGEVDGYILVGDDVSARRKTEDLLHDTVRRQAETVARRDALDVQCSLFIATASHELRTPVTSILGYSELLADGECGGLTPPQHKLVSRVIRNGRRLQHLIEDLLSMDRIDAEHAGLVHIDVDVKSLTERAWDSLQVHLVGRDLQASIEVPPDVGSVFGDATELERALLNLLTNAVKFTPDGGAVQLSVRTDSHAIGFEVSDTGLGISEDDQRAVFEPFFRTRDAHVNAVQGSGIGLAAVRRIVASHGGQVALTSVLGQGTRVSFTILASEPDLLGERTVA